MHTESFFGVVFLVLVAALPVHGQELTYEFSGTINQIATNQNEVIPSLEVGDPFSGYVTFDSTGWQQTIGTVSATVNGIELYFSGQYIYGGVTVEPGLLYDIRVAADNGGSIGDSTFNAGNFGPDLVDTDGSAGISEPFPHSLNLTEFEDNIFRILGTFVSTGDQISLLGQLDDFVKQAQFKLGDVNRDGSVDLLDVTPFIQLLQNQDFQFEADINGDGSVDLLDVAPFVALLVGN